MATLGANLPTLTDWAKRLDPDGSVPTIVELLNQYNEILDDMVWQEGNLPTGHRTTVRTSIPQPTWRLLNQGVLPGKSTTAQVDEACGMLEAWSEVDKDLAELNGNTSQFRLSEALAFIEGMNQAMASAIFYGNNGTTPAEFNGLAVRYNAISGANNASHVLDGGGTGGDNASLYLVVWGPNTVHGIFPKGSKAGLYHEDLGLDTVENTAGIGGSRMRAYRDHWQWKCGIALKDWRYVVRLANIDISNLVAKSSAADLIDKMIRMVHRIPNLKMGRPAFYMNRTLFEMLDIQKRDDVMTGGQLRYNEVDGILTPTFRGIPLRRTDALLESETQVV